MIMPNTIERTWVQGSSVTVENMTGNAFSGESGAHVFRISGKNADGSAALLSGSVLAKVLRADNWTVDVAGTVTDGVASVTLPRDCYNVPGRLSIVIFLSDGTNTITIYAAVANVYRSTSGAELDSGISIPTLTELLAQIENCEAAAEEAREAAANAEEVIEEIDPRVTALEQSVATKAEQDDLDDLETMIDSLGVTMQNGKLCVKVERG